jgi:malate synthase
MMHNETAPYFYLPKLEHYLEALVEQSFLNLQEYLGCLMELLNNCFSGNYHS